VTLACCARRTRSGAAAGFGGGSGIRVSTKTFLACDFLSKFLGRHKFIDHVMAIHLDDEFHDNEK
jgi:hypothetical protein